MLLFLEIKLNNYIAHFRKIIYISVFLFVRIKRGKKRDYLVIYHYPDFKIPHSALFN